MIPRSKGSLGFAQYLPNEAHLYSEQELADQICVALGGRVSEALFFGEISAGAQDDLQKVHRYASAFVAKFGMSDKVGYLGLQDPEYFQKHSEKQQKQVDQEIIRLVEI